MTAYASNGPPAPDDAGVGAVPHRHVVTLLFADLSRSTELAGAMEGEHYAALLAELRAAYNDEIVRHGGLVVRVQGDGLLAMFGYPDTREDDARRAVGAALALHARVRSLRVRLPPGHALTLHSGIHGGLVLVGQGDIERGRFELMGPVPNIAARLAEAARADEVLVSVATLGRWARHFSCNGERELRVRGHDEPVRVLQVLAARHPGRTDSAAASAGPRDAQGEAGWVGRTGELVRLQEDLLRARAGHARVAALAGPPGMGKTALAQVLAQQAAQRGWRVLHAYCDDHLGAEPMQPFAQVLRELGQAVPDRAGAVLAAVRAALSPWLLQGPVLLFIDDWQWADDASHQVLQALRRQVEMPLMVLLTTRAVDHPRGLELADTTLVLAPLSEDEAMQLARGRLPAVDPFVLGEVCRHAGGNPLFLGELCHSVQRASRRDVLLSQGSDQAGLAGLNRLQGAAGWLAHLVESRLRALPAVQAELLRAAAVIGNVVPAWLLQHLYGRGADDPDVRALAEQDFLYPAERSGTLRFKHGLTRDVVYERVGLHQRQWLHLRVASALLQRCADQPETDVLEALAYHFDAGGEPTLAARYAERAGDRALGASALDRARAHYRVALAALDRLGLDEERSLRWIAIVQRLGLVSLYDPTRADLALVQRALALAERQSDLAVRARARYWLSYIHYGLGDALEAVRHGEQALQLARQATDDPLAVQVVATLGEAHTAAGQYAQALALLDEAIAVKRRHRSGRRTNVGLAFSLVCRACVLGDRGRFADAEESFAEALTCVMGEEHEIGATIHGWRAAVLLWQGAWEQAIPAAAESARIARATRSLAQYSIACAIEHYAHWMLHGQPQSMLAIQEATAWLAPRETGIFRSLNHGWLTEGLLALGQRETARRHAALALRRARHSDRLGLAMSQRALALDAAACGKATRAARHLARAYDTARRRESDHERAATQLCEARIEAAQGRVAAAQALAARAGQAFERMAMPWHLAQARLLADGGRQLSPAVLLCPRPLPAALTGDAAAA
ncbi:adenylate/guanylate cyclase domain-containing protein [uncultured Piscinibacter sp.]|uniref:ATP-binding protein n=1 Tax=uncultured Piscinibacter sp. TaxID=1131835 RepID=UPI00261027EA|nr:adenylate/guanylate cyclase domain-containing protein [uncultured Piscinibacter sp.]